MRKTASTTWHGRGRGRGRRAMLVVLAGVSVALMTLVAVDAALAQCAMCRTALEQNGEMASGFNKGILFLLAMPYLVFGSITLSWYLRRRKRQQAAAELEARHPAPALGSEHLA